MVAEALKNANENTDDDLDDWQRNEVKRIYAFEKVMARRIEFAAELDWFEYCIQSDPNYKVGE